MRARTAMLALTVLAGASCATLLPLRVPEGPSRPLSASDAATAFAQGSAVCRGVRSLTAEIGLSGRVGSAKLRGRVLAGFERSGSVRLEAPAPFGAPIFVLAATRDRSVLWFPRDKRVLRDAEVADVIEALTGMRRHPDDLLAMFAGCLVAEPQTEGAEAARYDSGWIAIRVSAGVEAFLLSERQQWRIVGGRSPGGADRGATPWVVAYDEFAAGFPGRVRVSQASTTDVTFRLSQLEANVAIDPAAFTLKVPPDAVPMSLDELRQMGPLADRSPQR